MTEFKDYSNKRVVYIDDNALNLKVGCMTLKKFNIDADQGAHMVDLFEFLKTKTYDLIILDDMMDIGISGTEAMQELKKQSYPTPIIVLTGNATPTDRERYLTAGFDEYLAKPINIMELTRILAKFLD